MENFLKLTVQECEKAEKLLIEAGITYQVVDLSEEVATREVDYYFENNPEEIRALHEDIFFLMDYEEFEVYLKREMLHNIVNYDTEFFSGPDEVETIMNYIIETEEFIDEYREKVANKAV